MPFATPSSPLRLSTLCFFAGLLLAGVPDGSAQSLDDQVANRIRMRIEAAPDDTGALAADEGPRIARLRATGDLPGPAPESDAAPARFDDALGAAVERFQARQIHVSEQVQRVPARYTKPRALRPFGAQLQLGLHPPGATL